jgi:hypothetical protein
MDAYIRRSGCTASRNLTAPDEAVGRLLGSRYYILVGVGSAYFPIWCRDPLAASRIIINAGHTQMTLLRSITRNKSNYQYKHIQGAAMKKPDYVYDSFPATSMTKRRVGH